MYYGKIVYCDIANGLGCRTSLFVSGCRNHCKNCFNKDTWNFQYGTEYTDETKEHILATLEKSYIKGITILGGEPLEPENQETVLDLCTTTKARFPEKDIWLYTGFTFEQATGIDTSCERIATSESIRNCKEIMDYIDILVDGRFVDDLKDITLKYRGSSNQRIINVKKTLLDGSIQIFIE